MATNKIPVTFDFFKKYTYYEEWTEFLLESKAKGNKEFYETLASSESTKELALRTYYEAFYLQPKIREKYHIRVKPVPKRIRDKLLSIPVLDTKTVNKVVTGFEKKDMNKNHAQDGQSGLDNSTKLGDVLKKNAGKRKILNRRALTSGDACEEYQFLEDDDEPVSSDVEINFKNTNEQLNSSAEKQIIKEPVASSSKASSDLEIQKPTAMESSKDEDPKSSNNAQQENEKISTSGSLPSSIYISGIQISNATSHIIIPVDTAQTTVISNHCQGTNSQQKIIPTAKIPISLDEFKKFTHFEEIVEKLFKIKALNNEDLFLKYKNSAEAFANTLENYYRAFYFFPPIREICPIRMKPMPNFLKHRFLQIPEGINVKSYNNFKLEQLVSPELNMVALSENSSVDKSVKELTKVNDVSCFDVETTLKNASTQVDSSTEKQIIKEPVESSKDSSDIEIPKSMANDKDEEPRSYNIAQRKKDKICNASPPSTSVNKSSTSNYNDLKQYIHCCPLTLDEFCKYSNINELVKILSADSSRHHTILERFYVLFYLTPEHRTFAPFSKIRLMDNCPSHIKEKFFSFPTRLDLKDQNILNIPADVKQTTSSTTCPNQNEPVAAVNQHTNNSSNETLNNSNQPASKTKDDGVLNISAIQINNVTSQIIISTDTTQTTILSNNCEDKNSNCAQQDVIPTCTFPVSLDEFKKFTYFGEIVEKLFKIKTQNNEDLFLKYKSSAEAFSKTLENYYRAFYLFPVIREIFPIRLKPMPNSLTHRFLQIPKGLNVTSGNNFKLEQLVSPELHIDAISDKDSIVGNSPMKKSVTELTKNKDAANKSTTIKFGNETESCDNKLNSTLKDIKKASNENESTSPLGSIKRANNDINESPSHKRQKVQESQQDNSTNNIDNTQKSYKKLLPYVHCCPVSYSEFRQYTNASELFSEFCQKRYNSLRKLPFMLQRAYILFYLAPKVRSFKPFNNIKILDDCPKHLKDKMFEIPTNLYLKEEKTNHMLNEVIETPKIAINEKQEDNITSCRKIKEPVKILENILLQPASHPARPADDHFNKQSQCSNVTCIFHHISCLDFMKESNILSNLPDPYDSTCVQNMFKEIVYNIIKQQRCDKKYSINGVLLSKLLSHQKICEKCESDIVSTLSSASQQSQNEKCENEVVSNLSSETKNAHSTSQNERVLIAANKTVIAESSESNERTQPTTTTQYTKGAVVHEARHDTVADKRSTNENRKERSEDPKDINQEKAKSPLDLCKYLKNDEIFSIFCQQMLDKLKKLISETDNFSTETYETFLQCNEIPLREILNEFCNNNEEIVQRILNNRELCDALQYYYYTRYLTNSLLASKYPLKIKQQKVVQQNSNETKEDNENTLNKNECRINNTLARREMNSNSPKAANVSSTQTTDAGKEKCFVLTLNAEKVLNKNNTLEKAKRIFFRNVEKTNTLPYVLRTSFGLKQFILRSVLTLTFQEFLENTNVYEGKELYADNHIAECMYLYVFHSPLVWPTNLYVTLEFLCKFLHEKNIRFEDYATMLTHISPKLLHWSVLLACTDIVECVQNDYQKRTGKFLDTYDTKRLKEECIEYYNRCWKYEKWIGQVPLVYEEFYKDFLNDNNQGDASVGVEPALQRVWNEADVQTVCKEPFETANTISETYKELEVEVETFPTASADRPITEFDCVVLPNTQQQIELLPAEVLVSNDPLNNNSSMSNLNVSSCSEMSCTIIDGCLEKPNQSIKPEPIEEKLLSNLLFYEDDNSDIQCSPYEDEIIDVNNTLIMEVDEENLPPSQMIFEDPALQLMSDILVNSQSSSSSISLAQHHQSLGKVNDAAFLCTEECFQPTNFAEGISTTEMQLPDVSLRSSGENEKFENVQEKLPEHVPESFFPVSFESAHAFCEVFSTEQTNTLPDVSLSSGENEKFENVQEKLPEHVPESSFPVSFESAHAFCEVFSTEQTNTLSRPQEVEQNCIEESAYAHLPTFNKQQEINVVTNQQPTPCISVQSLKNCEKPSTTTKTSLPLRRVVTKVNATNKSKKDVAKVRPLQKSDLVSQIQHNTRPLQTKPAYTVNSSADNNKLPPISEILPSTSLKMNLAPTINNSISQEFNKNCSVFDNTSLLRIVDHDYYQRDATNNISSSSSQSSTGIEKVPALSVTIEKEQSAAVSNTTQQSIRKSARINSIHSKNTLGNCSKTPLNSANNTMPCINQNINMLSDITNEEAATRVCADSSTQSQTSISVTNQRISPRSVTSRSGSLNTNTNNDNDKVNNIDLTNTNNIVASIVTPTIYHPNHYNRPYQMIHKLCLHRGIIKFHYFKELTPEHISEYLLPSLEIGKSYTEALVVSENFRTRICNRSVSALFTFWPQNTQRDFLTVLNDLKEFHYVVFERASMEKQDDLRVRVLFWLLNTAPSFSFCHFLYEESNKEFSHCEAIKNANNPSYKRKPFKCLTNALKPTMLEKLKESKLNMKRD